MLLPLLHVKSVLGGRKTRFVEVEVTYVLGELRMFLVQSRDLVDGHDPFWGLELGLLLFELIYAFWVPW